MRPYMKPRVLPAGLAQIPNGTNGTVRVFWCYSADNADLDHNKAVTIPTDSEIMDELWRGCDG
jgi:hypothetical protein